MLRCSDGTLYTGCTNDLEKRVKAHNAGRGAKYTKHRLPVEAVYTESHCDRATAQRAEAAIKKLTRAEKLKKVQDGWGALSGGFFGVRAVEEDRLHDVARDNEEIFEDDDG